MPDMMESPAPESVLHRLLAAVWDPDGAELPVPVPWAEVMALARTEGVTPLLYAALRQTGMTAPERVGTALAQAYYGLARANTLRGLELEPVLAALSGVDVPVLLLKGMALAETLYDNIALRPMSDFDLVVHRQDVPVCQELLTGLGYRSVDVEVTPGAFLAYRNEQIFAPPKDSQAWVELHWHLLDVPYYLRHVPMAWFWETSRAHRIGSYPIQILGPEANLLYLSSHLALHHRFHGLRWFVDLAALTYLRRDSLDWDRIARQAQAFELLLTVRETLDRLAGYWPSLPLEDARRCLQALQPSPAEQRIFRLLTAEPRSPLLDFYADLVCLPDLPARANFALRNVFPQPAYMARRYGVHRGWQLPFFYLYRLGAGFRKLVQTLPQVIRLG